jgi:hypothetical protein
MIKRSDEGRGTHAPPPPPSHFSELIIISC